MSAVGMNECQKKSGFVFGTNENLLSNLKDLIGFFLKLGFEIFKPRFEVQTRVVRPTGLYLLDFFCSGIQFYLLLSPYIVVSYFGDFYLHRQ